MSAIFVSHMCTAHCVFCRVCRSLYVVAGYVGLYCGSVGVIAGSKVNMHVCVHVCMYALGSMCV